MDTKKRRNEIKHILESSTSPITANTFAKQFLVSRQVIVNDISILRASGLDIESTSRGYIFKKNTYNYIGVLLACHSPIDIEEELLTIVDYGGTCIDVTVYHSLYGRITCPLNISSRYDVSCFIEKLKKDSAPLSLIAGGVHTHRIGCNNKKLFDLILKDLKDKGLAK